MSKIIYLVIGLLGGAVGYHLMSKEAYNGPRKAEYPVEKIFISRWSPRAFTGDVVSKKQLMSLFEAARWAPSSYNLQPWRFIFALKDTPGWQKIFNTLVPFNQSWAKDAGALIAVLSQLAPNGQEMPSHSFDTGAATENLALQADAMGLAAHAMAGFDKKAAKEALSIPDGYEIEAIMAVGKQAPKDKLPKEFQERELPSDRKKIAELVFEDSFGNVK